MKIEKINDNQIRCIITRGELLKRNLTLKKLSSGSSESRALLREILQQSFDELGFEAADGPFMVEAAPMSEGNLVFTITKPGPGLPDLPAGGELMSVLKKIFEITHSTEGKTAAAAADTAAPIQSDSFAVFAFEGKKSLPLPPTLTADPVGVHTVLYYAPQPRLFYLTVHSTAKYADSFRRTCHLLSEYARTIPANPAAAEYYREHYETVFSRNALKHLAAGEPILPTNEA